MPFRDSPRLKAILDIHGDALVAAVARREEPFEAKNAESVLFAFAGADPSRNKSATQWLVRTYIADGFRLEDLGKARETLTVFAMHRRRLPSPERDLGRYRTLADLWKAVKPFVEAESHAPEGREARRLDRERARAESVILHEGDDGFIVAVPETEFAAKWWGRGTRWCTAADRENRFCHYDEKGPLVVIVLPGGQKLQLFVTMQDSHLAQDFQYMDDDDHGVPYEVTEKYWPCLEPVIRWAARRCGYAVGFVPERLHDHALYLDAVRATPGAISYVRESIMDREICMAAVKGDGDSLGHVPSHLKDREMCELALETKGTALAYVPLEMRNRDMFLKAVRMDGEALRHVPPNFRDREICFEAVRRDGLTLAITPPAAMDGELCMAAVRSDSFALTYVPPALRTRDMYLEAVRGNGDLLQKVPEEEMDLPLILEAIRATPGSGKHVPGKLKERYAKELHEAFCAMVDGLGTKKENPKPARPAPAGRRRKWDRGDLDGLRLAIEAHLESSHAEGIGPAPR